jgi:two-component system sensor histidine kinase PilS (NtrC family)
MSVNQTDTIYPCPFSKNYGIPRNQAWLLLKVFSLYRFMLSSLFVILLYSRLSLTVINPHYLHLYGYVCKTYLVLAIISGICSFWRNLSYTLQAQSGIFIDIIAITLLMHACGGIDSGVGILLAASIASSGLLIGGRCSIVFAALASIAVLTEQAYGIRSGGSAFSSYPSAGMLGASFFTIALLSHVLAKRSEQSDLLASQQKQTISTLEALNKYIIQHLQSGLIIINKQQDVYMANEAALQLLEQSYQPNQLSDVSSQFSELFLCWLNDQTQDFLTLERPDKASLQLRFSLLPTEHDIFYLIVLEDSALHNQRLQQGILASLGRLTASIAHEIRNPLSAISHASQLLSESPNLNPQDLRLTEIIQHHSSRMNKIISDILQSSKRQPSNREKVLLDSWLPDYLDTFITEQALNAQDFELVFCQQQLYALIDPGHLKQILDNLCLNALKYGAIDKGSIILQVSRCQSKPCIAVVDHGHKLSSEVIRHLFEPFFTTSSSGTGLGLYISRELAELNQAKLSYELTSEQQSSFKLCLSNAEQTKIEL